MRKKSVNFRLSDEARLLLVMLAAQKGLNMTATLEVLIREAAKRGGKHGL